MGPIIPIYLRDTSLAFVLGFVVYIKAALALFLPVSRHPSTQTAQIKLPARLQPGIYANGLNRAHYGNTDSTNYG